MPSFKETIESRVDPLWGAIMAAIVMLYGFWPGISFYNDAVIKSRDGMAWVVFLPYGLIGFFIVLVIGGYLLGGLFCLIENKVARIAICLALVLIFWNKHGVPHPFILIMILIFTVIGYFQNRKARQDSSDREEFFNE